MSDDDMAARMLTMDFERARKRLLWAIESELARLQRLHEQASQRQQTTAGQSTSTESIHQGIGRYEATLEAMGLLGLSAPGEGSES